MSHGQAVLVTLILYKLVLVGLGLLSQRRVRDGVDFFLGGRGLGPTVAAISASASSSSAWTLLGVSGAAYAWGLSAVWLFPACVGGFALNWYGLARRLRSASRSSGAVTVTEVLAGPPGQSLHGAITRVAAFIVLFSLSFYVASQFQAAGKAFHETFQWGMTESILLGSAVVILYTLLGGFWAVSLTDTLQGLVMAATAAVLPVAALVAVGGPGDLLQAMRSIEVGDFLSLTRNWAGPAGVGFVLGVLGIGLGYPGQPHVVNRFMALQPGERPLRRARWMAMAWAVVVYAGMLLLGWCGRVLYPALADREVLFVRATNDLFPPVLAGVMLAAVLSAIMSTADSQLLVAGSAVTQDLKLGGPTARTMLRRSRLVVVLLSVGAVGAALYGSQEIFSRVLFAWSAMGAAFGPALLVTVLRGPPAPGRVLAAMVLGFVLSVTAYNLALPASHKGFWERVVPFAVATAILLAPEPRRRELAAVDAA
jgi:sodium/proline symporter